MRIGRKPNPSCETEAQAPQRSVVGEVTRTWQRNAARYRRLEEPFAALVVQLEGVPERDHAIEVDDDTLLAFLRGILRVEDDIYPLGRGSFLAFLSNADFMAGEKAAFRLGTAVSTTPLVTTSDERVFVTFAHGLAEWDESIGTLNALLKAAYTDLKRRGYGHRSDLRPAS